MREDVNLSAKDARVDIKDEKIVRVVNEGPSSSTYQTYPATNQSSTSSTIFQINPPSSKMGVGRYLRLHIQGSATFTGTNLGNLASFALRAWPLASIMTSCQVQINNANIAYAQQNQFMPAFARVANPVINQTTYQSGTATNPDLYTDYNDCVETLNSPFISALDITAGEYAAHSRTEQITGMYRSPDNTKVIVYFDIAEPILVAPFCADSTNIEALYNVQSMNIAINWGTLHKMFSVANLSTTPFGSQITGFDVAFTTQELLINYVAPHENTLTTFMPTQVYNAPSLQLFTTATSSLVTAPVQASVVTSSSGVVTYTPASFKTATITSNTITLPRCPRLVIAWVTDPTAINLSPITACGVPDRCYPVTAASVNCYNRSSLLAGASPQQLYEMSIAAGLNATQSQFLGRAIYSGQASDVNAASYVNGAALPSAVYTGAPLVIDFSNLSLPPGIAPGVDIQTQFQITLSFINNLLETDSIGSISQALTGYQLNLLVATDGYLLCTPNGGAEWIVGGLSPADVKLSHESSDSQFKAIAHQQTRTTLLGGNFWDTLKDVGRTVLSVAAPVVSAVAPELAPVVGIASKLAGAGRISKQRAVQAARKGYY